VSHNPDTEDVIVNEGLRIRGDALAALMAEVGDDLPEGCFLHDLPLPGKTHNKHVFPKKPVPPWSPDAEYLIEHPHWYGEGSGSRWDTLIKKVLPRTLGRADIIYCWEGGEWYTGIRVRDGVVTEHEVVRTLGPETKRR
jgi:hypothetical protein